MESGGTRSTTYTPIATVAASAARDEIFRARDSRSHRQSGQRSPQAIRGKDGRALLSWRVAILPYLNEEALYREFRLDEPWDSEHNKKLIARMPPTLASPHLGSDRIARLLPTIAVQVKAGAHTAGSSFDGETCSPQGCARPGCPSVSLN